MVGYPHPLYSRPDDAGQERRAQQEVLIRLLRVLDEILSESRKPAASVGLLCDVFADRLSIRAASKKRKLHHRHALRIIQKIARMSPAKAPQHVAD